MCTWDCVCVCVCESWHTPDFLIHSSGKHSNSLSDSCFLFCEPAPLGSWGVIPHTGPAGGFTEKKKKKKKKTLLSPALTHSPANSTNSAPAVQKSTRCSSSRVASTCYTSRIHKTKLQRIHNWIRLLIQLCVRVDFNRFLDVFINICFIC